MLYTIILSIITLVSVLLVIVILLQPGQGQGISGGLAGGQAGGQGLGARRTADLLSKSTTVLGTALIVLSVFANFAIERGGTTESAVQQSGVQAPAEQTDGLDASQSPSAVPELPQNQGGNNGGGDNGGGSGDNN